MGTNSTSSWRKSAWGICTTCEPARATATRRRRSRRRGPRRSPSASGAGPIRTAAPDICEWTRYISAVDAVTQWQVVGCASKISEAYLLPVLAAVLAQFPFVVLGFHVDNGSEYINHRVAKMMEKLHAEFTKSRACRSQDNALVE